MVDSSKYMTLTEAAKRLGISRWTLYRRIDEGAASVRLSSQLTREIVRRRDVDTLLSIETTTPVAAQSPLHEEGR